MGVSYSCVRVEDPDDPDTTFQIGPRDEPLRPHHVRRRVLWTLAAVALLLACAVGVRLARVESGVYPVGSKNSSQLSVTARCRKRGEFSPPGS